jgi:hypothetical protein
VDGAKGMHKASKIKSVGLAFVTDSVDEWYGYLQVRFLPERLRWLSAKSHNLHLWQFPQSQGVSFHSPLSNSTSLPIRGFVAYDPEGYTLEYETFLPDPENDAIRQILGLQSGQGLPPPPSFTARAGGEVL